MVNTLSSEELLSLVEKYPWFSPARAVLCRRALETSGREAAVSAFNDALLYFPDAGWLAGRLLRNSDDEVFKDPDCSITKEVGNGGLEGNNFETAQTDGGNTSKPRIILAGMDYFTKEDYDSVRDGSLDRSLDRLGRFTDDGHKDRTKTANIQTDGAQMPVTTSGSDPSAGVSFEDMVTETLGQIYAEQGYISEAKDIYSKLSLQSPEKSTYFASLIKELEDNSNN